MSLDAKIGAGDSIGLGKCDLYLSDNAGVTEIDLTKTATTTDATELTYLEKFKGVKTKNSGDEEVDEVYTGSEVSLKFVIDDVLNKETICELSSGLVNDGGILKAKQDQVGKVTKKYHLRAHPHDMPVDDNSLDVVIPNCSLKIKLAMNGKSEEMWTLEVEGKGFYPSDTTRGKLEIGYAAPAQA